MTELEQVPEEEIQLLHGYEILHLMEKVGKDWLVVGESIARFAREHRVKPSYPDPFLEAIGVCYQKATSKRRRVGIKDVNEFIAVMKEMGRFPKIMGDKSYIPEENAKKFRSLAQKQSKS